MTTVLVVAAFALAAFFPLAFAFRSNWRSNSPGKAMMTFSIIVAAVLGLRFLSEFGVELPRWVRLAVYGSIVVGLLVQDITLVKVQNRRNNRIRRERESEEALP